MLGGLFSSLFGKGGAGTAGAATGLAQQYATGAQFSPYTVRTGYGAGGYMPGSLYGQLGGAYGPMQGATSLAATGMIPGLVEEAQGGFGQRAGEIFKEQSALLQPEFQKQATQLQSRLFGGGRLGLRLAGESQGLGTGAGMVQPDALGLGRAQQQTLAQLESQARQQAMQEFGQRRALQQGLFGQAQQLAGLENQLAQLGLTAEQMRAASMLGAGNLAISPMLAQAQLQQQSRGQGAGFFGSLLGAAIPLLG